MNNSLLIGIVAAAIGGLVTYLVARRTTSGSVDTSDAATLWTESQAMRKELRDEVVTLRSDITSLKNYVIELEKEKVIDRRKIANLLSQIKSLENRARKIGKKL